MELGSIHHSSITATIKCAKMIQLGTHSILEPWRLLQSLQGFWIRPSWDVSWVSAFTAETHKSGLAASQRHCQPDLCSINKVECLQTLYVIHINCIAREVDTYVRFWGTQPTWLRVPRHRFSDTRCLIILQV